MFLLVKTHRLLHQSGFSVWGKQCSFLYAFNLLTNLKTRFKLNLICNNLKPLCSSMTNICAFSYFVLHYGIPDLLPLTWCTCVESNKLLYKCRTLFKSSILRQNQQPNFRLVTLVNYKEIEEQECHIGSRVYTCVSYLFCLPPKIALTRQGMDFTRPL